ncbi:MAG: cyclic nucleotide-binding domain-containing protein [Fimbriimonadia bacterium]|nr:cyclic nucleotide-binding domain-containing protein [Fimbriimonadia bacterium]
MNVAEAIKKSYLVKGMSEEDKNQLVELAQVKKFFSGDVMIRQFDRNNDLIVVLQGSARVRTISGDVIAELGPGSVIGEISLIDEQPRSATVVSSGETTVAVIPSSDLRALIEESPYFGIALLRNLAKHICAHLRLANIQLDAVLAQRD